MNRTAILLFVLVSGCTTTAGKLEDRGVTLTLTSINSPRALATCIADNMTGANLRSDGEAHYWVVRENSFGAIGRWDVYATPTGSRAEWRRASGLTTGGEAGQKCAAKNN